MRGPSRKRERGSERARERERKEAREFLRLALSASNPALSPPHSLSTTWSKKTFGISSASNCYSGEELRKAEQSRKKARERFCCCWKESKRKVEVDEVDRLPSFSLNKQTTLHSSLASSLLASPRAHVVSLLSGCARSPMPRMRPAATRVRYLSSFFFFQFSVQGESVDEEKNRRSRLSVLLVFSLPLSKLTTAPPSSPTSAWSREQGGSR